jgi:hypothetical protein
MIEQEPNVIAVLEELLPYELDMLEGCFLRLHAQEFLEQRRERRDGVSRNAWIESFWVHARNLYEFFRQPPTAVHDRGIVSAHDMAPGDTVGKLEDFTDRMPPAGVEKVGVDWRGRS